MFHCRGHQNSEFPEAKGNAFADKTACELALKQVASLQTLPIVPIKALPKALIYTVEEKNQWSLTGGYESSWKMDEPSQGEAISPDGSWPKIRLIEQVYYSTYLESQKLTELLQCHYYINGLDQWTCQVLSQCHICTQLYLGRSGDLAKGIQLWGEAPREHCKVDFIDILSGKLH